MQIPVPRHALTMTTTDKRGGLRFDLPIAEYHADKVHVSNSGLADFEQSPEHFHALHLNPDRPPPPEKKGQLVGQLAHCATLEAASFPSRYVIRPEGKGWSANSNQFKDWAAEQKLAGLTPITEEEHDNAWAMAASIRADDDIGPLLEDGTSEVSAYWRDPATGVLCRCRPDFAATTGKRTRTLLDVKTYASAKAEDFMWQVDRMGYARQDVFYSAGYAIAADVEIDGFVFVAVEDAWPFACAAYLLPDPWRDEARRELDVMLARFAECQRADIWPGYPSGIQLLPMPPRIARAAIGREYGLSTFGAPT